MDKKAPGGPCQSNVGAPYLPEHKSSPHVQNKCWRESEGLSGRSETSWGLYTHGRTHTLSLCPAGFTIQTPETSHLCGISLSLALAKVITCELYVFTVAFFMRISVHTEMPKSSLFNPCKIIIWSCLTSLIFRPRWMNVSCFNFQQKLCLQFFMWKRAMMGRFVLSDYWSCFALFNWLNVDLLTHYQQSHLELGVCGRRHTHFLPSLNGNSQHILITDVPAALNTYV